MNTTAESRRSRPLTRRLSLRRRETLWFYALPCAVLFFVGQRCFNRGLAFSGVQG